MSPGLDGRQAPGRQNQNIRAYGRPESLLLVGYALLLYAYGARAS